MNADVLNSCKADNLWMTTSVKIMASCKKLEKSKCILIAANISLVLRQMTAMSQLNASTKGQSIGL